MAKLARRCRFLRKNKTYSDSIHNQKDLLEISKRSFLIDFDFLFFHYKYCDRIICLSNCSSADNEPKVMKFDSILANSFK